MDVRYLDGVIGDLVKYFLWMLTQRNDVRTWTQSYLSGAFGPSRNARFEGAVAFEMVAKQLGTLRQ